MSSFFDRRGEQRFVADEKRIGLPGVLVFGAYNYHEAHPGLAAHRHDGAVEIVYLGRGEQTYRVGENYFRLRGGDQFLTFPDEWHDTGELPEEKGMLFWMVIQPGKDLLNLPKPQARALTEALTAMPARHFQAHREAEPLLREILDLLASSPDQLGRVRLTAAILRYLLKTCEAAVHSPRPAVSSSVRRALEWIDENPDLPGSVDDLASAAGLSVPRFKARFKQELGIPPREYVLRRKILSARELLKGNSVTETAFALGFSSSQYFATVFRRFTGKTPSEFSRAK